MVSTAFSLVVVTISSLPLASCGPRVEYRARPGFATSEELPDEITLPDGTIVRYISRSEFLARKKARQEGRDYEEQATPRPKSDAPVAEGFQSWQESEDGTIRMQAIMPEHVVANAMRAFREERYGELWDQLVAQGIRTAALRSEEANIASMREEHGDDGRGDEHVPADRPDAAARARERFVTWCENGREDVMTLLNRMSFGFSTNAIIMRKSGPTTVSLELTPQISADFRYKVVDIEYEGDRLMLSGIH